MIDNISVITKGGLLLWEFETHPLRGSTINSFIQKVLLEEKASQKGFNFDNYIVKWTMDNETDLVIIVVHQKLVQLLYVDDLLRVVKEKFCNLLKKMNFNTKSMGVATINFDQDYQTILKAVEEHSKKNPKTEEIKKKPKKNEIIPESEKQKNEPTKQEEDSKKSTETDPYKQKLEEMKQKKKEAEDKKKNKKNQSPTYVAPTGKTKKKATKWDTDSYNKGDEKQFDFSNKDEQVDDTKKIEEAKSIYFSGGTESKMDVDETYEPITEDDIVIGKDVEKKSKGFFSYFTSLATGTVLDEEDLKPVLDQIKSNLQEKNVALSVSDEICDSVSKNLIGKNIGTFSTIKTTVRDAMDETLTRILTPSKNIDVLRDAMRAREQQRPYVITFVGVNGVGKSTSLSKVCYWLQQNNLKVMIAACDTFRSGAVEQLRVHSKCLNVELYEKGYGKDAASIANEAIKYAKKNGIDVVLVDTAGRMQENEPLMKALNKLVVVNEPDLVLFVGEALVGNDGVDQLTKFNQALSIQHEDRRNIINGVLLTKFDTIDDKVGAAISMVYSTGIPILFLGVGQTYTDLKKLSVKSVVKSLMQ
eukprot:gene8738-686_t